jgi:anti-sigma regulatory factor (Ser/Thr protein kinase)
VRAGLPAGRADDFVIAVSEIAANAVRYGSPAARLLLRVAGGAAQAEVRDSGCWRPAAGAASADGRSGG